MFKNSKNIIWCSLFLLFCMACEKNELKPLFTDGSAPGVVSGLKVENLPGAAKITYTIPDDDDLLYVKATVETAPGKSREIKSSLYANHLLLEGFGESKEFEVTVHAVDRSENISEPVKVTVHPLTPPVQTIFESLSVEKDFGGLRIYFENEEEENMALVVMIKDEAGEWVDRDIYYTRMKEGSHAIRGFEPVEREFKVYVKDRWGNTSEEGSYKVTPLFEEQIPKTGFREHDLPTDTYVQHCCGTGVKDIWDGITDNDSKSFHTKPGGIFPVHFTFDMGITSVLSRFKLYGRSGTYTYNMGNLKNFEIWGIAETPPNEGSWDGWIKLADAESFKPSGQPVGTNTAEDLEANAVGQEFPFPPGTPPVRYIRVKVFNTWGGVSYIHMNEMTFWGQIQD